MDELVTTDPELVVRAQGGDLDAFQALYDRYFPRVYDFAYQMVRNREDAADLASDVFLKAIERLGGLRDPEAFVGWLYSIARNAALNLVDRRKRTTAMPEHLEPTTTAFSDGVPPPDPSERAEDAELRELVWQAAATLDARDYSIFEMSVRQGLGSGEIAEALGVKPSHAYVLVNRMKSTVSDALAAVVLARVGRRECPVLDGVVAAFDDERSPAMRKAVTKHLRRCEGCQGRRKRYVSPAALLGGVALAAPAVGVKEQTWGDLVSAWQSFGPGSGRKPPRRRPPRSSVGTLLLLLLAAVALLAVDQPAADPILGVQTPSPPPVASPTITAPAQEAEATPEADTQPSDPTTRPPIPTPRPATPVPADPPRVTGTSLRPTAVYAGDCVPRTARVTSTVSAPAGVASVVLSTTMGGSATTTSMTGGPTTYTATAGPFSAPGTASLVVTVTDTQGRRGSSAVSLPVQACPTPPPSDPSPTPDCRREPNHPDCRVPQ